MLELFNVPRIRYHSAASRRHGNAEDATGPLSPFVRDLRAYIERHALFAPGDTVVVAVSGGPDSMALLHGLFALGNDAAWLTRLHVAHLHHGIRGAEADADEALVREVSKRLGLACTCERVDVLAEAKDRGISVEEAARDCRHAFYERVCLLAGSRVVAVGHHADDNAETIVHRLFRGTGLHGLAGMRPSRRLSRSGAVRLVRPLLGVRRARIRTFIEACDVPFHHDATNDALTATRNRIRHQVIPLAEKAVNPQAVEALLRLAEQAAGLSGFLRETAERLLDAIVVDQDAERLTLDAAALTKRRRTLQTEVIRLALLRAGCREGALNGRHLAAVAELGARMSSGAAVNLPGGFRVERSYARLMIVKNRTPPPAAVAETLLDVPGRLVLSELQLEITAGVEPASPDVDARVRAVKPPDEEWLDWDAAAGPLFVRRPRPGDRFRPLGMPAAKKIAEFLAASKVPRPQRSRALVLCDQKGVLWVIPWRIDERARVTAETRRILRLRCSRC